MASPLDERGARFVMCAEGRGYALGNSDANKLIRKFYDEIRAGGGGVTVAALYKLMQRIGDLAA